MDFDALVVGAGPAGMIIAAALAEQGVNVGSLTASPLRQVWPNTYGIWRDELEALGLTDLLGHCWDNCVSYFGKGEVNHGRAYGLFDKVKLQNHLLAQCEAGGVTWQQGEATQIEHDHKHSIVTTGAGESIRVRVVIDASGHKPMFIQRPDQGAVAFQTAYGIVGHFSAPPVEPQQFVLQDFRSEHLSVTERATEPPTFLYAMDFGDDVYFVEETSLAMAPPVSFELLERRLHQRLAARGVQVTAVQEVERCIFPMTLPLPDLHQPVVAFGGAASMVHPASGYMVGALLRRGPGLAAAIATALQDAQAGPAEIARKAWQELWNRDRLRKYYLYRFGLEKLMRFDQGLLNQHFDTFFSLPKNQWSGFLADTLSTPELVGVMMRLFAIAPNSLRWGLLQMPGQESNLLWQSVAS
ncbi:lycopene beta cyclase [Acaryochloris marina]|uniref:Lycopene beta cyclase CrtL n=1 Tax=Acaryochloris marina (strain MBIC 11017) TaxID=329726 RepID=B0C3S0_ACAM1|nr:lycopene beta cyclase CrtL [Acaryochloris marina MBIC11017]BDM79729.1 lycopene cyclase [Acaryochloris marina MBIC10699]